MINSHVTFVLMAVVGTFIAAFIAFNVIERQEIKGSIFIFTPNDDSSYENEDIDNSFVSRILSEEYEIDGIKDLDPLEVIQRMKSTLERMDKNKNGFIEKNELFMELLKIYRKLSIQINDLVHQLNKEILLASWNQFLFLVETMEKEKKIIFHTEDDEKNIYLEDENSILEEESKKINHIEANTHLSLYEKPEFTDEHYDENSVLKEDEIYNWASTSNKYKAESEAEALIETLDSNKDGMLSYDEIMNNYIAAISPNIEGYYIIKD